MTVGELMDAGLIGSLREIPLEGIGLVVRGLGVFSVVFTLTFLLSAIRINQL